MLYFVSGCSTSLLFLEAKMSNAPGAHLQIPPSIGPGGQGMAACLAMGWERQTKPSVVAWFP